MRRQRYLRPIPASLIAILASFVATPASAQLISIDATLIDIDARVTKAFEGERAPVLRAGVAMDTRRGEVSYNASVGFHI